MAEEAKKDDAATAKVGESTFADGATTLGSVLTDELVSMGESSLADKKEGDKVTGVITN